jgi:hypothetical protein
MTRLLLCTATILALTVSANAQFGGGAPLGIDGVYRPSGVGSTPGSACLSIAPPPGCRTAPHDTRTPQPARPQRIKQPRR